jgi:hypothetical protein
MSNLLGPSNRFNIVRVRGLGGSTLSKAGNNLVKFFLGAKDGAKNFLKPSVKPKIKPRK